MEFKILLADKIISIHTINKFCKYFCFDYIIDSDYFDFEVYITDEDIEKERVSVSDSSGYLESLAVYRKISEFLIDYSTLLLHGAVIAIDKEHCFLFAAPSGIGKTTHIKKWLKNLPEAFVVNGDKPLIKITENKSIAYGTPWSGKENLNANCAVPLKGIIFLKRANNNKIQEISFKEAFSLLLQLTAFPNESNKIGNVLDLLQTLSGNVKFYTMDMNNYNDDAFTTSYNVLKNLD